jgi:hypothetical protein
MNRVRAGYPGQLDDLATLTREPADTVCSLPREVTVTFTPPRILRNALSSLSFFWSSSKLAAGERFERPYPDSKSRVLPLDDPAVHSQRYRLHATCAQYRRLIDVVAKSPAIGTRTIHQFAMIPAALTIELRCELDLKAFEFNRLCTHNLVAARRIDLPSQP